MCYLLNITNLMIDWYQISYTIAGFDRLHFVSDITDTIPQDETCRIMQLSFFADGIQARGQLIVRMQQPQGGSAIENRLRAVRGMVRVQTDPQPNATR